MKAPYLTGTITLVFLSSSVFSFSPRRALYASRFNVANALYIPGKEKPGQVVIQEGDETKCLPLPDEISREICLNEMVFCERLPEVEKKKSGLFLPGKENPYMHVARVVSSSEGATMDNGCFVPNSGIKAGDLVFLKFPWGIGPRDEEFTDETGVLRRFSYIRYQDVAGVVREGAIE